MGTKLKKSDIIRAIHLKHNDISEDDIDTVLNAIFSEITNALQRMNSIEIRGFGTFYLKKSNGKRMFNPRSKEFHDVPEHYIIRFKPGRGLKEAISSIEIKKQDKAG